MSRKSRTRIYAVWSAMNQRCSNPRNASYPRYGGRGIVVCERWRSSFDAFVSDMGPKPSPAHSLDRIDNDGNYEPGNCRWATHAEQSANTRKSLATHCKNGHAFDDLKMGGRRRCRVCFNQAQRDGRTRRRCKFAQREAA